MFSFSCSFLFGRLRKDLHFFLSNEITNSVSFFWFEKTDLPPLERCIIERFYYITTLLRNNWSGDKKSVWTHKNDIAKIYKILLFLGNCARNREIVKLQKWGRNLNAVQNARSIDKFDLHMLSKRLHKLEGFTCTSFKFLCQFFVIESLSKREGGLGKRSYNYLYLKLKLSHLEHWEKLLCVQSVF